MREVCCCGWAGDVADRAPVYAGDGDWGLACPRCSQLDRLAWLPDDARTRVVEEAARRQRAGPHAPRARQYPIDRRWAALTTDDLRTADDRRRAR